MSSAKETGRLAGKVAVITGAGNGMGQAAVRLFLEEGAQVLAADISEKGLEQWNSVDRVVPLRVDVTRLEDIRRMVQEAETRFGRIDALCNIAGINDLNYPLLETDDARWDRVMEIDLKAPFRLCREVIPVMIRQGGGSIVNIGSYAALRGNHGPSYTAAKAGVEGLTRSIAFGYGDQGVRCNIIHPGGTNTNIGEHSGGAYHPAGERLSRIVAAFPKGWFGQPEDIARTCLFLCSDDASHINGAVISVDGGMSCC